MVKYDTVLIRYGELTTKGKNRKDFIRQLERNIRHILEDIDGLVYERTYDRMYIRLNGADSETVGERLKKVFGISSFSFTEKVASDIETISQTCLRIAAESGKNTFKIIARRHDKTFPMVSDQINRAAASVILKNTDLRVDVHEPQLPIYIEVHREYTYITSDKIRGAGGYPTGINGRVLLLLSGGIDSPVAAYELMKRGLRVEAVHFAAPPYTSDNARQKVVDLAGMVSEYQGSMRVHVINFTNLQLKIYEKAGDSYAITIMRRMMFRIAEAIARKENCLAIATGESIGQVASQTLESMSVINDVVRIPVIRPLVCADKIEIIDLARKIGTYETSILPYEDCCTIFDPKNPVTKPTLKRCEEIEEKFEYQPYIEECITGEEIVIAEPKKEREDYL